MPSPIDPAGVLKLRSDTIKEIYVVIEAIWNLVALAVNPWPPKDAPAAMTLYTEVIANGLRDIAGNMAVLFTDSFPATHNLFYTLLTTVLGNFGKTAADDYHALLLAIFNDYAADLLTNKTIDPNNANTVVAKALERASALGVGSRLVTILFEVFLPKSLNFMNWLGPQLAQLSGYEEIVALSREPQLKHSLGNLAEYNAAAAFRTRAPEGREAEELRTRGLITPAQYTKLIGWSGLMVEFEQAKLNAAYRPVSPRILSRAVDTGAITHADLISIMTFGGYRPQDQTLLLAAFDAQALQPYKQATLSALMTAAERGTIPDAQLVQDLQALDVLPAAIPYIQETIAYRRLEQLAELYRKSVSEGYKYGTITDADYVTNLEAIGINVADAEAHYAVDSIAKQGRVLAAATRAEAALAKRQQHAAMTAAIAEFRAGAIDAVALLAAMLAAGVDPTIANFAVTMQTARAQGPQQFLFGVLLPRAQALALKEQVSALAVQTRAGLVSPADALAGLASQNIPTENAKALVAEWVATKTPAADVGVLEPR